MVEWNISAAALLTTFVAFYIITISTYTYISSLSNVNISSMKVSSKGISLNRLKRDSSVKYNTDLWQKNITLNKCCGQNHIMNYYQNRCESKEHKLFNPSDIVEKMEFFVVDENLKTTYINPNRINFAYDYYDPSFVNDAIVVNWVLNSEEGKTNFLFLQQDASLLELDADEKNTINKKFSTNSYCLDENNYFGSGLIAYINPCVENMCFRKCCPRKWHYNTIQNECVIDTPLKFQPEFYFTTTKSEREIPYYLLHGEVKCSLTDSLKKINARQNDSVYVQEDGFLLVIDHTKGHYYYYDNKSYCIDMFSNGIEQTYLNGFYCQKEASFMRPEDVDIKQFSGDLLKQSFGNASFGTKIGGDETHIKENTTKITKIFKSGKSVKKTRSNPEYTQLTPNEYLTRDEKSSQEIIYAKLILAIFNVFVVIFF